MYYIYIYLYIYIYIYIYVVPTQTPSPARHICASLPSSTCTHDFAHIMTMAQATRLQVPSTVD